MLPMQAGGGTVDQNGELIIASDANVKVIAHAVSWCLGPDRIAIDAPEGEQSGYTLWQRGQVIAQLMPDWGAGQWKNNMPAMGGKVKLMPLPAWQPGGRRTTVRGGTMLGFPKTSENFDQAWAFAKNLYLSEELARKLFEVNHIISPVRDLWDAEFYKVRDPYFSNQQSGLLYIELAPEVPVRTSSPYHARAITRMSHATIRLYEYAEKERIYDAESLMPKATELLQEAEDLIRREMQRNVFVSEDVQ
jgi:arabinosaccharide transport system substrate-binding protein